MTKAGVYLGIDLSLTASAFCLIDVNKNTYIDGKRPVEYFRTWCEGHSLSNDATFEQRQRRVELVTARLIDICAEFDPAVVVREADVFSHNHDSLKDSWGLGAVVDFTAFKLDVVMRHAPVQTWRAFLRVPSPAALKKQYPMADDKQRRKILKGFVREIVAQRWGVEFEAHHHNEAEAYAIARFGQALEAIGEQPEQLKLQGGSDEKRPRKRRIKALIESAQPDDGAQAPLAIAGAEG